MISTPWLKPDNTTRRSDEMIESCFNAEKGLCQMEDAVGLENVYKIEVVY
jgi:hypothetical protein